MAHAILKPCLVAAEGRERKEKSRKEKGEFFIFYFLIMCMFGNKEEKRIISFDWFCEKKRNICRKIVYCFTFTVLRPNKVEKGIKICG